MATATNPQAAAQKWASAMQNAAGNYKAGVQAVTTAPTQQAAAAADRYAAGVQQAVASGKYQQNLQAVSLQAWQNAAVNKGATRIGPGASAAQPKMQAFLTQFLPFISNVTASLPPRGDLSTNIQRMVQTVQAAAGFKYQKPAS